MHRVNARRAAVVLLAVAGLVGAGGIFGVRAPAGPAGAVHPAGTGPADRLAASIARTQEHLRRVPGDWTAWAGLGVAYVERARITTDPTYYPKAQGAVERSLALRPHDNTEALVARAALAN